MDQILPQIAARRDPKPTTVLEDLYKARDQSPATLVVHPKEDHRQTFILLHGRGDTAQDFGAGLLLTSIPEYTGLREAFPHAKFIFPLAPIRPFTRCKGWKLRQWFDNWGYDEASLKKEDLKVEGLRETTAEVHDLITEEVKAVGAQNIVLGGLSNGCAASMVALMLWDGEVLGGGLFMCGHLPFRADIEEKIDDELYMSGKTPAFKAISWVRERLGLSPMASEGTPFRETPIFVCHGDEDRTVPTECGRQAAQTLKRLESRSVYVEYMDLAHWYRYDMLYDFVRYIKREGKWNDEAVEEADRPQNDATSRVS